MPILHTTATGRLALGKSYFNIKKLLIGILVEYSI